MSTKEEVLSEVFNKLVPKVLLRLSLLDCCSVRKRTGRYVLFEILVYQ